MIERRHLLYFSGRIVPTAIGFLGLIAYSHLLSADVYGDFALTLSWAMILSGSLLSWIRITMTRFAAAEDEKANRMIGVALTLQILISAATLASLFILALMLGDLKMIAIASLATTLGWSDLCLDLLRARHNALGYSILYLTRQFVTVASCLTAIAMHTAVNPMVLGYIAGAAASGFLAIGVAWPRPAFRFGIPELVVFVRHGLPLSVNFGLSGFANTVDKLLVIWLLGSTSGGVYALASDLVRQLIATVMEGASLAALPDAASAMGVGGRTVAGDVLMQNLAILLFIGMPAAFGLAACSPAVASTFLGEPFQSAASILIPAFAIGGLARGIRTFFLDVAFQVADRTMLSAAVSLISIALLGGLCLALIPSMGILGAAVGVALGLALALPIGGAIANRYFGFVLPKSDLAKIFAASLGAAAIALVMGGQSPSHLGLANAVISGVLTYTGIVLATNALDIRTSVWGWIQGLRTKI